MAIDTPRSSQLLPPDFLFSGWAADLGATGNSGIDAVHVYAYPNPGSGAPPIFLGPAAYGSARGDVAAVFGSRTMNSGYSLPVAALAPGTYDLVAYAHSTVANAFNIAQAVRVRVLPTAAPPYGGTMLSIDVPGPNAPITGALFVGGWALDLRSKTGTGVSRVDLWAYPSPGSGRMPIFLGTAQYRRTAPRRWRSFWRTVHAVGLRGHDRQPLGRHLRHRRDGIEQDDRRLGHLASPSYHGGAVGGSDG